MNVDQLYNRIARIEEERDTLIHLNEGRALEIKGLQVLVSTLKKENEDLVNKLAGVINTESKNDPISS